MLARVARRRLPCPPAAAPNWAEHLKRFGRVSFTIDVPDSLEQVIGQGNALEEPNTGGQWVDLATRMPVRYLGPNGPSYLEPTLGQPRALFRIIPTGCRRGRARLGAALLGRGRRLVV